MGKLTAVQVRNLREPGRYSDGEGLILKFFGSGRGSWIVRVQADGKRRDIGLGTLAEVGLAEAREAARGIRRDMKNGVNIVVERKKEREEVPTFKAAAELVHEEHKAGWKNGKHQQQWMNTLETYAFPKIGKVLVSDIEGPAIRDVLAPIWLTKPETARRVRQRIGAVLDWAYSKGYRASEAPIRSLAKGLPRQPKKRGHFEAMPYEEVPDFIAELRSRVSIGRLALELPTPAVPVLPIVAVKSCAPCSTRPSNGAFGPKVRTPASTSARTRGGSASASCPIRSSGASAKCSTGMAKPSRCTARRSAC
ncbi:MAG: DUF4102 domain-containing protein [Novosphingobium sp.]|nr:DUF4102 domain-containing protein [Novosphingobium sp.]